jgi:hypothetical protein
MQNRGWLMMPAALVIAVLSGMMVGSVGAGYFQPTPQLETAAQRIARASRKWCPPDSSTIQQRTEPKAPQIAMDGEDGRSG